jgi:flagellar basal-body rod modification protein FlgD
MLTSAIDNNAVSTGGSELSAYKSNVMGKDDFLKLLITQLQHQDPLKPTDSTEFTAQLAQFSSLEQLNDVNDNLLELQNFQASINNAQAVSLIGKDITAKGNFVQLTDDLPVGCPISLANDAAVAVVNIYDSTGEFVKAFESPNLSDGRHTLFWDGTDKHGNRAANGNYTFEVLAADSKGENIQATTYYNGTVNKVTFEDNLSYVITDNQKIALGDVVQVSDPAKQAEDSGHQGAADDLPEDTTINLPQSSKSDNSPINGGK